MEIPSRRGPKKVAIEPLWDWNRILFSAFPKRALLQSNHYGIEIGLGWFFLAMDIIGCNRTIMGLKFETGLPYENLENGLQSNHYGIEIQGNKHIRVPADELQSNHYGIEMVAKSRKVIARKVLQSNHYGIEITTSMR